MRFETDSKSSKCLSCFLLLLPLPTSSAAAPKRVATSSFFLWNISLNVGFLWLMHIEAGVYILATFLESFPCPIVQNQVILPPKMAKRYTCGAFDQANIFFWIFFWKDQNWQMQWNLPEAKFFGWDTTSWCIIILLGKSLCHCLFWQVVWVAIINSSSLTTDFQ